MATADTLAGPETRPGNRDSAPDTNHLLAGGVLPPPDDASQASMNTARRDYHRPIICMEAHLVQGETARGTHTAQTHMNQEGDSVETAETCSPVWAVTAPARQATTTPRIVVVSSALMIAHTRTTQGLAVPRPHETIST